MTTKLIEDAKEFSGPAAGSGDHEDVFRRLEEEIVLGLYLPLQRLVEEEIAERMGAKRHVVRQALTELRRIGLVEHSRNKGAVVRLLKPDEVEKIYAVREILETAAASLVPLPAPPELIGKLEAIQAQHDLAVANSDITQVYRRNIEFHQTLFAACGNQYLAEAVDQSARRSQGIRYFALIDGRRLEKLRRQHWEMIEAIRTSDRARLVELHREHLLPSKEAYLESQALRKGLILNRDK